MIEERKTSPYISVSALNRLIKNRLEEDIELRNIYVKGEISNWKAYKSAFFFDLKDESDSTISCLLWSNSSSYLSFDPKEGDEVIAFGSISVYAQRGRYSLTVFSMQLYGQGLALLALEALKKKLAAEGLFDEARKKRIPAFPRSIGLIVGKNSAAEADLIKNIERRWPLSDIYVFNAQVQGQDAPKSIIKALLRAESEDIDTLIIARGGGSNEDLYAFNDENLVRAVSKCKIPVIAAVGHEIDTTLIDYVADLRVSTPTGAVEAATPDQEEIKNAILESEMFLQRSLERKLTIQQERLKALSSRQFFQNPSYMYEKTSEKIKSLSNRIFSSVSHRVELERNRVESYKDRLELTNPDNIIKRGYSMTINRHGKAILSKDDVRIGEEIKTKLKDGIIVSTVKEK